MTYQINTALITIEKIKDINFRSSNGQFILFKGIQIQIKSNNQNFTGEFSHFLPPIFPIHAKIVSQGNYIWAFEDLQSNTLYIYPNCKITHKWNLFVATFITIALCCLFFIFIVILTLEISLAFSLSYKLLLCFSIFIIPYCVHCYYKDYKTKNIFKTLGYSDQQINKISQYSPHQIGIYPLNKIYKFNSD